MRLRLGEVSAGVVATQLWAGWAGSKTSDENGMPAVWQQQMAPRGPQVMALRSAKRQVIFQQPQPCQQLGLLYGTAHRKRLAAASLRVSAAS